MKLSVREMTAADIEFIVNYFANADHDFLIGMGADPEKLPGKDEWIAILSEDLLNEYRFRAFYYIIWQIDNEPIGHSNINLIKYGKEAFMHLHMWTPEKRQRGLGSHLMKKTIPFYFRTFKLQKLYCEPYALNPAPNKTLPNLGFEFVKEYETTPGWLNFKQKVNRWVLTRERFGQLFNAKG